MAWRGRAKHHEMSCIDRAVHRQGFGGGDTPYEAAIMSRLMARGRTRRRGRVPSGENIRGPLAASGGAWLDLA